jgi:hypothetical protein
MAGGGRRVEGPLGQEGGDRLLLHPTQLLADSVARVVELSGRLFSL